MIELLDPQWYEYPRLKPTADISGDDPIALEGVELIQGVSLSDPTKHRI
jgi:hypothetical protein